MEYKNRVRNTAERAKSDLLGMLVELHPASGGVEAQEARGQKELIESTVLPAEFHGRETLEAAGVKFGALVDGDELFVNATLPAGWKKVATEESMHSELLDELGRRRATIAYKAAFYDRYAHGSAIRRFSMRRDYERKDAIVCRAMDGKRVLHETVTPSNYRDHSEWYKKAEVCDAEMCAWMTERFPKWDDASAYWDLPDDVTSAT